MPIRWLVFLTSVAVVAGGSASLWNSRHCSPLETSDDCTTEQAYQALWSTTGPAQAALRFFGDAVVQDPSSPQRWCDLAEAFLLSGDSVRATTCSRIGFSLGPRVPAILLRTLNFGVAAGCTDEALSSAGRLLEMLPGEYDDVVFAQLARSGCRSGEIQSKMLALYPGSARLYLWHLMASRDVAAAADVWAWMRSRGLGGGEIEREYRAFVVEHIGQGR